MASKSSKIPSINMFFQKHADSEIYTDEALLYQDILRYSIISNPDFPQSKKYHSFTAWELTSWLIDNNRNFREHYRDLSTRNTPKHVRIASRSEGIKGILDELTELGLIQRLGYTKASRGNTITVTYIFTRFGYVLAWIVESFDASKRNIAEQKIYYILDYHFRDNKPSSKDMFYSTLHKKFKENGVYGEFVVDILKNKINSNAPMSGMTELLGSLILTNEQSISNAELYHKLWVETINQMPGARRAFLFQDLKLEIERKIFEIVTDTKTYERLRYDLREKYDVLAMEVVCQKCRAACLIWTLSTYRLFHTKINIPSDIDAVTDNAAWISQFLFLAIINYFTSYSWVDER